MNTQAQVVEVNQAEEKLNQMDGSEQRRIANAFAKRIASRLTHEIATGLLHDRKKLARLMATHAAMVDAESAFYDALNDSMR